MAQVTVTPKNALIGGLAVAVAGLGIALGVVATSPPSCLPDPTAAIAQGGVWNGGGNCYTVPNGIEITAPVTVENATFNDPTNTPPAKGSVKPVLDVTATTGVTLSNLTITGGATDNMLHPGMVNQSGIRLRNSANVGIFGITVSKVFGDGLELWTQVHGSGPNTNVTVAGLNVLSAGRDGLTPADVTHSTFSNITVGPTGQASIDFESDVSSIGAGDLVFSNCTWKGWVMGEALSGPILVQHSKLSGQILMRYANPQAALVTFSDDTSALPPGNTGILLRRGNAAFTRVVFSRTAGNQPPSSPMWDAELGSTLAFNQSTLAPPLGTNDATSTVTVTP